MTKTIVKSSIVLFVLCILPCFPSTVIKHQSSNGHFDFYSTDSDAKSLKDVLASLEENYGRITKDLQTTIDGKIRVTIYPDVKSYHVARNMPDAPDWVVGNGGDMSLDMVSPLNPGKAHTYASLMNVVVHEFTHVATRNLLGEKYKTIPKWLFEGLAEYEAGPLDENNRGQVGYLIRKNQIPSFDMLEKAGNVAFGEIGGYGFSYTIIDYLVRQYGMNTLIAYMMDSSTFEKIFGTAKSELEKEWLVYLKEHWQIKQTPKK